MTGEITNRAPLDLLEDIEARRLANEELLAKATDHITRGVYANRLEVWTTAIRIVTLALPTIVEESGTEALDIEHRLRRDALRAETDTATWAPGEFTEAYGK